MSWKKLLPQMIGLTSVILLLAACGTSQPASTPDPPTPISPTNTPLPPTPTPVPPTATPLPPAALITVEDLVGVWKNGDRLQTFVEDGTYGSSVPGQWGCRGQFWFEGGQLHVEDVSANCSPDQIGIYEVQGIPQDYLVITLVSDEVGARKQFFRGTWEWVASP